MSREVTIEPFDCHLYREVWEVTEWRDGRIYRTKSTGRFVRSTDKDKIDKTKYTTSPISTKMMRMSSIVLPLFEGN